MGRGEGRGGAKGTVVDWVLSVCQEEAARR